MAIYSMFLYPSKEINGPIELQWRGNNKPTTELPLKKGDTIIVTAMFGTYEENHVSVTAANYYGLSLGAGVPADADTIKKAVTNRAGFSEQFLYNITTNSTPGTNDMFVSAVTFTESIERDGTVIPNMPFCTQMIFNPGANAKTQISKESGDNKTVVIFADYGDPHKGSCDIPVEV